MAEQEYQRLSRARRRTTAGIAVTAGYSSLWLGKDHVLCVDSTGFNEEYKRFYFRDIQAISIQRTNRRLIYSILILIPLLLFVLIAASARDSVAVGSIGFFLLLPLSVMLIYNLGSGPTTKCFLRTAVQTEELYSLNRLRRVRKALDQLEPLIVAAQGQLTPNEMKAQLQEAASSPPPTPASPPPPQDVPPPLPPAETA